MTNTEICRTAPEPAGWPALFGGPTGGVRPDWQFYRNWSGGNVGLSKEYFGTALTSQAISDAHCAADVGPGYRMAEHHDNGVGGPFRRRLCLNGNGIN